MECCADICIQFINSHFYAWTTGTCNIGSDITMSIRRHCDPINVKKIWDAVRSANVGHQACDTNRIFKYLQNSEKCSLAQIELYLKQCINDGLLIVSRRNYSGNSDGFNCTYRITEQELPDFDGKDWYCFECHLAGEVNMCVNCFRVFHSDCIKSARTKFESHKSSSSLRFNNTSTSRAEPTIDSIDFNLDVFPSANERRNSLIDCTFDEKLCSVCNLVNIDDCKLEKGEMNYLLKFVLHRIRNWLPNTITHTMAAEDRPSWLTDSELTWRANQLFFEHRDMSVIEVNLNTESYSILSEFLADILTVQHNVAIFHGIESQEYQAAELMVLDTLHDITELRNCPDCYRYSNEKINAWWFALPCREPHNLVWAKQKGYPYWPAKVIKETPSHCDVRFFGGKHERSLIHKSFIKSISVSKESLKIKPSSAFTKSLEELIYHQRLLTDPREVENILTASKFNKPAKKLLTPPVRVPKPSRKKATLTSIVADSESGTSVTIIKRKSSSSSGVAESSSSKKTKEEPERTSSSIISGNVINISDGEEEETDYSFRGNVTTQECFRFDENYEQVSSSTENDKNNSNDAGLHQLDQPYSDSVEKMRRKAESLTNKNEIIKCAMECMQAEIDRITEDHNEHLKRLFESHNNQISETKKKQWCFNCEQDAIYHCCWNTAYCSQTCQQQHWQAEHKKVCRRKRQA
ncbi:zinc finger MYND domain-containing protein 11 isoform X2 [Euwallacea similis]|uniref:zinc finger MYND domain-containing protein 11 isoform X2 n=1 Tax=Euwallacea similis TaxID=1736056 RepID=UPI00344D1695